MFSIVATVIVLSMPLRIQSEYDLHAILLSGLVELIFGSRLKISAELVHMFICLVMFMCLIILMRKSVNYPVILAS